MQFNQNTISLLIHTIRKYGWMDLPSYGTSMYPFIQQGNICRFVAFDSNTVRKGDILLYHSCSGQLIAHRFHRTKEINNQLHYQLKGDTNLCLDKAVSQEQIIGKLMTISREKHTLKMSNLSSMLWGNVVINLPILSKVFKTYLAFKENQKARSGFSL